MRAITISQYDSDMSDITCPGCGRVFKGKRALAGHRTVCDAVHQSNNIPVTCGCFSDGPCEVHEANAW